MDHGTGEREHDDVGDAIRAAALPFIQSALPVLAEQHLYPRPKSSPFIRIGTDYFGNDPVLPGFVELAAAVKRAHPRFSDETSLMERDFADSYVYSFLEACVSRLTASANPSEVNAPGVARSIDELVARVTQVQCEIVCCRVVSHVTTVDRLPHRVGDVEVVPLVAEPAGHRHEVLGTIRSAIDGAGEVSRDLLSDAPWGPPESVLIVRANASDPFEHSKQLTRTLNEFLLMSRLLRGTTAQSAYEVQGEMTRVCKFRPQYTPFRGQVGLMSNTQMVRRDLVLSRDDDTPLRALRELVGDALVERPGMVIDPLALAVYRYNTSPYSQSYWDQVIELATALEAAMAGKTKTDVVLRLRTRCAALLATERDPAAAIFDDIGKLYDLRSRIIHGGETKTDKVTAMLTSISTTPKDAPWGETFGYAVDRLRDLVRRSVLARICLARGGEQLWPLNANDADIDRALCDDATRAAWRAAWHGLLDGIGAHEAWDRVSSARSTLGSFSEPLA